MRRFAPVTALGLMMSVGLLSPVPGTAQQLPQTPVVPALPETSNPTEAVITAAPPPVIAEAETAPDATGVPELAPLAAANPEPEPEPISPLAPAESLRPEIRDTWAVPVARWDDNPNGARWTMAVLSSLRGHGAPLLDVVPRDIDSWCPGYPYADQQQRAAFWTGLISTLAWHESTHRQTAIGGGGRWFGLVQIAPGTARWRNCEVRSGQALLNGVANLRCGVRIMAITVPRDQVISEGMRGVAADWGPFHSTRKREDMRNWVSSQEYCQIPTTLASFRPEYRPDDLLLDVMRPVFGPGLGFEARPTWRPEDSAALALAAGETASINAEDGLDPAADGVNLLEAVDAALEGEAAEPAAD